MKIFNSIFILLIIINPARLFGQTAIQDSLAFAKIDTILQAENFSISTNKKSIPKFVRKAISKIDKKKFKVASAGDEFNAGDIIVKSSLPNKRIVYTAHNDSVNVYFITYEQGGFGRTYYSRIVEYYKSTVLCITTLIVPSHDDFASFKNILGTSKRIKIVYEKSTCMNR